MEQDVNGRSLVAVVDDDESVRESLPDLLREGGYAAVTFAFAFPAYGWRSGKIVG